MKGWESYEEESLERLDENKFIFICLYGSFFSLRGEPRNAIRNLVRDKGREVDGTVLYRVCVCVFWLSKQQALFKNLFVPLVLVVSTQFKIQFVTVKQLCFIVANRAG